MNEKRKWVTEMCSEVALWDGMDAALIGIAERCGQPRVAVYDRDKALSMLRKEMTPEPYSADFAKDILALSEQREQR